MDDCTIKILNLIIQIFIALGTISVSILAIWGGYFRYKFGSPKIKIIPENLRGDVTWENHGDGPKRPIIYYYLKVFNSRSWSEVKNCKIILKSYYIKLPNGKFQQQQLMLKPTFQWTIKDINNDCINFFDEHTFNFGLIRQEDIFWPALTIVPNNFIGTISKNETKRFTLEVIADGFKMKRYQTFEVAWNGQFSDNLDEMSKNLQIIEI